MTKELLKVSEAAEMAGLGRSKAYELILSGEWPRVKIGRASRIPRASLMAWIKEREEEASKEAHLLRTQAGGR